MVVQRYEIYFRLECCLSEYYVYYFLFVMWMKLCKLNQASDQCEKPDGKRDKNKKQGHAYIWDLWCLIFSYFTSENIKVFQCAGFW